MTEPLPIAQRDDHEIFLLPQMANRHGLITGATGTGKTVTLQTLAEAFSRIGTPVFMADVKGDLSGVAKAGGSGKAAERAQQLRLADYAAEAFPVVFWDVWGEQGHPVRATVSDMGPLLLARMFNLNETQEGVLNLVFKIADDQGLLLLDLKDLRAMLQYVGEHAKAFTTEYGNISAASIGAIQRGLLALENQGGDRLFGEPMLNIDDLMQTDAQGRGVINLLAADRLMQSPKAYGSLLLWLLAELFENLPEAGDLAKPKLVFFFDEAHLLFKDAPQALLDKIELVVRLIRSKGVGVYFVSQNPADVPDAVAGQLGNRVQHALRAFTPKDQKALRAAAETLRDNAQLDEAAAIAELGVGEALVSCLDAKGQPTVVERALIVPPRGQIGPITAAERSALIKRSVIYGHYEQAIDRESAYEILRGRTEQTASETTAEPAPSRTTERRTGRNQQTVAEAMMKSAARAIGSQLGRAIIRGVLGSILGGRR